MVVMFKCINRKVVMVKCINSQNGGDGQVFATVRMMVMVVTHLKSRLISFCVWCRVRHGRL